MAGYWFPLEGGYRVYTATLKDAYRDGAAVLYRMYKNTNGNVHRKLPGYASSEGYPIYNSRTGKTATHWVRFHNGSNPKDGYELVSYSKRIGVSVKGPYKFPKNW